MNSYESFSKELNESWWPSCWIIGAMIAVPFIFKLLIVLVMSFIGS